MTGSNLLRSLKSRLGNALSSETKLRLKKLLRKARSTVLAGAKLDLHEMESILVHRLGISAGDAVLVHSSFGMLNAAFSPHDLIRLLKRIVTAEGLIAMPYYPPMAAIDWLARNEIFDHKFTPSSMGILTTVLKDDPEACVSIHPIKAIVAWGKGAEGFVEGHHRSNTPFDEHSPYAKLKSIDSAKSIGLGIERCTFFHHCEDILLAQGILSRYVGATYTGVVRDRSGHTIEVETLVHDPIVMGASELSCSYFRRYGCPTFVSLSVGRCPFYSVSIPGAYDFLSHRWRPQAQGTRKGGEPQRTGGRA